MALLYLPSFSIIVTVAYPGLLTITSLGSEDELMVRVKFSFPSNVSSSFIGTLSKAVVIPTLNVTLYGPAV